MTENILYAGASVEVTDKSGVVHKGKISHNGAYLDKEPITLILGSNEEKWIDRSVIANIKVISNINPYTETHYYARGRREKSKRRKNKRNKKRNTKRRS